LEQVIQNIAYAEFATNTKIQITNTTSLRKVQRASATHSSKVPSPMLRDGMQEILTFPVVDMGIQFILIDTIWDLHAFFDKHKRQEEIMGGANHLGCCVGTRIVLYLECAKVAFCISH
jgi:hypothetical protein